MTDFSLKRQERRFLEGFVTCPCGSRELRRAQALLWISAGDSVEAVAERLRVSRQSVYNWQARFSARRDLELTARLADGERHYRAAHRRSHRARPARVRLPLDRLDGPAAGQLPRLGARRGGLVAQRRLCAGA